LVITVCGTIEQKAGISNSIYSGFCGINRGVIPLKKVSRTNDLAFKKAFSSEGSTEAIIGLCKDILDID